MDDDKKNAIVEYALLGFILTLVGWLAYKHTGSGPNQLSPQFWAGVAVPLFAQLLRKTFDLKKPDK